MRVSIFLFLATSFLSCSTIDVKNEITVGVRQFENDSLKESITTLSKVIQVTDTCSQCFLYRGFAYKGLKDYSKSIEDFNSLIKLDPKESVGYANRASIYYMKGNYRAALSDFTMAYKLDSSNIYLNPICHMLFINGFKDSACIYYQKLSALGDTTFDNSIKNYCEVKNNR